METWGLDKTVMGDLAFIGDEYDSSRGELLRVMGLDMGSKTIGVALSDELGLIAQAKETVHRQNTDEDLEVIADLARKFDVERIVVGLPVNMNGTLGVEAQKVLQFVEDMRKVLSVPIIPWDERLSTVQAGRILLEAGLSRKKRKKIIDKTAATVILQTYLDAEGTRTS